MSGLKQQVSRSWKQTPVLLQVHQDGSWTLSIPVNVKSGPVCAGGPLNLHWLISFQGFPLSFLLNIHLPSCVGRRAKHLTYKWMSDREKRREPTLASKKKARQPDKLVWDAIKNDNKSVFYTLSRLVYVFKSVLTVCRSVSTRPVRDVKTNIISHEHEQAVTSILS